MSLSCGIVGLPNVGKSTLFNALTTAEAEAANYPFCTIDPNVGMVAVPDARLQEIATHIETRKIAPTMVEFHDIAGLVRGASRGEGLGNKFLGHIRSVDAIVHVLRCFTAADVVHTETTVEPQRDLETIETELIIRDHETVSTALARYGKLAKSGNKSDAAAQQMLEQLEQHLQNLNTARTFTLSSSDKELAIVLRDLHLLTAKSVLYVCNVDDAQLTTTSPQLQKVQDYAASTQAQVITLCARVEAELAQLDTDEQREFLDALGLQESGLQRMIAAAYRLLGLQTYFTAGLKEIKAWTIKAGTCAPAAAGKIHSDFERGFICAEVFTLPDLQKAGSKAKLKEKGLIRTEGKDYVVQDGDIMEFRFNV